MAKTNNREAVRFNKKNIVVARHDLSRRFDAFEVHPIQALDKYNNVIHDFTRHAIVSYEQCNEDDEDIYLWGVYGHLRTQGSGGQPVGGLESIADCSTKEDAEEVMFALGLLLLTGGVDD